MTRKRKLRIAFLVSYFPKLSETFILDHIINIINDGHNIDIYPGLIINEEKVHKSVSEHKLLSITHYPMKVPSNILIGSIKLVILLIMNYRRIEIFQTLFNHPKFKYADLKTKIHLFASVMPFLRDRKYDIIHCHFGPSALRPLFIKSLGLLKGKMITTFYGYDVNINSINQDYYSELFHNCNHFIAISNYIAYKAISLGCQPEKIKILPIGVDLQFFKPENEKKYRESIKLLTVGRLVEKKGVKYAILAFNQIHTKYPNLTYDIVGQGILYEDLNNLVNKLKLSHKIKFHGAMNKDSILDFYRKSDIFILPCVTASDKDTEGQGLVLQEAQAVELPVISTYHNGIQEGVLNNNTGFLVPEKDIRGLAEKIEILVNDRNLRIKMGRSGRDFVSNNFNSFQLHKSLIDIYMQLINSR